MLPRSMPFLVVAVLVALCSAVVVVAADQINYEGMVVSAGGGKLALRDKAGKESSHTVGTDAQITVNGRPGKLEDLKPGMTVRATSDGTVIIAVATVDDKK